MVIKFYKSTERKGYQQGIMAHDCILELSRLNNDVFQDYFHAMKIKTYRINAKHTSYIPLTYHIKPNKW